VDTDNSVCSTLVILNWTARDCDDYDDCTDDSCDPSCGCQYTPTNCDDTMNVQMTLVTADEGCVYNPISCDDYNTCTKDTCDPTNGCTYNQINCTCDRIQGCVYSPMDSLVMISVLLILVSMEIVLLKNL